MWLGPLNAKTLTSLKACYYYNVQMPGTFTNEHREIWFWVMNLDQIRLDPLYPLFSSAAAAIAYGLEIRSSRARNIWIYDFGGGTRDESLSP